MGNYYLGGPMRGLPRYNFDAFEEAENSLKCRGIKVISPHRMDLEMGFDPDQPITPKFMEGCVRRDVDAIIETDGIIFLPGWEKSVGAKAERAIAQWLDRPCYQYPILNEI